MGVFIFGVGDLVELGGEAGDFLLGLHLLLPELLAMAEVLLLEGLLEGDDVLLPLEVEGLEGVGMRALLRLELLLGQLEVDLGERMRIP